MRLPHQTIVLLVASIFVFMSVGIIAGLGSNTLSLQVQPTETQMSEKVQPIPQVTKMSGLCFVPSGIKQPGYCYAGSWEMLKTWSLPGMEMTLEIISPKFKMPYTGFAIRFWGKNGRLIMELIFRNDI